MKRCIHTLRLERSHSGCPTIQPATGLQRGGRRNTYTTSLLHRLWPCCQRASTTVESSGRALQKTASLSDTIEVDRGPHNTLHGSNADCGHYPLRLAEARRTSFYGRRPVPAYRAMTTPFGGGVGSGPITDQIPLSVAQLTTDRSGGFDKNPWERHMGGSARSPMAAPDYLRHTRGFRPGRCLGMAPARNTHQNRPKR